MTTSQPPKPFLAAAVQAAPSPGHGGAGDLTESLDRLADLISDAANRGAKLVACGETFLPGYPAWFDHCPGALVWDKAETKALHAAYRRHSVAVPGPAHERLGGIAADHGVVLVVGVSERVDEGPGQGSLYNSLLTYDADGRLANHHRKLVPTYTERCVWGHGDQAGLRSVETAVGRVSALVCWEHWMPLPRQALHEQGETVHIAVWPTVHERHQIASRHYAFEGRTHVIAVGQIQRAGDHLPPALDRDPALSDNDLILRGGSCVIAPNGDFLAGPVFDSEELILAEIDPVRSDEESMTLDVTGHYHRAELFEFKVREAARRPDLGG
jgi:nitrilase